MIAQQNLTSAQSDANPELGEQQQLRSAVATRATYLAALERAAH